MKTETKKSKYQRYESYKDSGIEWLGEIPSEWEIVRYKDGINFHTAGIWGSEAGSEVIDFTCVRVADFDYNQLRLIDNPETKRSISNLGNKELEFNDLLLEKSGGGDNQPVGRAVLYQINIDRASCSNFIERCKLNLDKVLPSYFILLSASMYESRLNTRSIKQTTGIQNLDVKSFFSESIPLPSLEQQEKIVKYLEAKTSLINQIIEKKKKLIALLKEKRSALINKAVTKGLDDNAELVDSGVEWIGEIPKDLTFIKLKYIASLKPSKDKVKSLRDNTIVSFLAMEQVSEEGVISLNQDKELSDVLQGFTYFEDNDLILAKITPCFENGKGAVVSSLTNGIGFGSTEFIVIRPNPDTDPKFIYYVTKSEIFRKIAEVEMTGSAGQKRVPEGFVANYFCPNLTNAEQLKISRFLDQSIELINKCIERTNRSISLINDYKQSLITKVVKGEIKI